MDEYTVKSLSRVYLLLALLLAAINLRPGITSLAPLIERIAAELDLSRGVVGMTTALPVLCMGLLAPLAPRLGQRFGLERSISLCLVVITLSLVMRVLAHNAVLLITSAALLGAGIAIAGPLLSGFIKRHFIDRMGNVVGWYSLCMAVGGAAGVVLTLPAMQLLSAGWTYGLAVWSIPALVALMLWLKVPNQIEARSHGQVLGLPWREPRAWLLSGFFALQAGLFYTLATWAVARYHEAGLSLLHSNSLFSLTMLMGLPSAFVMPWLGQRFGNRYLLLMGCGFVSSICLGMITFAPTIIPEVWAIGLGFGLSGSFSLALLMPLSEAGSPMAVSRWTAMMLFTGYSTACVTPVATGLLRDISGSYQWPFLGLTILAIMLIVLAWFLKPRKPELLKSN